MKKNIAIIMSALLLASAVTACGSTKQPETKPEAQTEKETEAQTEAQPEAEKLSIVTTIFPEYDWVSQIVKDTDSADIKLLLDKGVDLHSYQPTAEDIVSISSCDLFIYVGGESDEWVEDALAEATNKEMKVINLLEALGDGVKEEEVVEGMEAEEEEEEEEEGEEEEAEYDEHVWLSLGHAQSICRVIADTLAELDGANADKYLANADAYCQSLAALDQEYQAAVDAGEKKVLLFADRFPFRYLVDDYGIDYYAAFVGCSAETEASFETILFLANKTDELGLTSIMQIESADGRIADTVKQATKGKDQQILTMDSMQSQTMKDVEAGTTYLSIMENNLEVLKEALK